jgi:hypothetical protein
MTESSVFSERKWSDLTAGAAAGRLSLGCALLTPA